MSRKILIGVLLLLGCKGLDLEGGNAYPCDYALGPGLRDEACFPGDVCGVDDVCKKYIYEGPRFEGAATVPTYGPGSPEGVVLHPAVLDEPITLVTRDIPIGEARKLFVRSQSGALFELEQGRLTPRALSLPTPPQGFAEVIATQVFSTPLGERTLLQDATGRLAIGQFDGQRATPVEMGAAFDGFRVIEEPPGFIGVRSTNALPVAWDQGVLSVLNRPGPVSIGTTVITDLATQVRDVGSIAVPNRIWLLALTDESVMVIDRADAGVSEAATLAPLNVLSGTLRSDPGSRVLAVTRRGLSPVPTEVLSTFQVTVGPAGPELSSPWPDCAPCGPAQRIELMTPSVRTGTPTIELLCLGGLRPSAVRVVGSVALTQVDACLTEQIDLPIPFSRVTVTEGVATAWQGQSGLALGGIGGEVWLGDSLSQLSPLYLDRVPFDVAPADIDGSQTLAALTTDFLALQEVEGVNARRANGFRRLGNRELNLPEDTRMIGFVHDVANWGVVDTGEVVRLSVRRLGDGGVDRVSVEPGPQLVTSEGEPITRSIGGEAFTGLDGGLAFFLVADDSLYFLPEPTRYLGDGGASEYVVTPDLTPEPSVPIRSLALERTPLGTDGEDRARGYLVTSRNVYEWQLGGSPPRWSAKPMVLSAGEPLEVWFDSGRSALGRVGFTDGQVFTLPGGYLLVDALPADEAGVAAQVLDYENLGGWPVAYTTTGLFIAGWDRDGNGKLQNRFPDGGINRPMTWRPVTLPDGTTPWRVDPRAEAANGRLFVKRELPVEVNGETRTPYRLVLFLEDRVFQVATHLRK